MKIILFYGFLMFCIQNMSIPIALVFAFILATFTVKYIHKNNCLANTKNNNCCFIM